MWSIAFDAGDCASAAPPSARPSVTTSAREVDMTALLSGGRLTTRSYSPRGGPSTQARAGREEVDGARFRVVRGAPRRRAGDEPHVSTALGEFEHEIRIRDGDRPHR